MSGSETQNFKFSELFREESRYFNHVWGRGPVRIWEIHAFYFISNIFISNARLKFANFQNLYRKILRTELLNLYQMIALFLNSILNTFLSGRVKANFSEFWISLSNIWAWAEKNIANKKACNGSKLSISKLGFSLKGGRTHFDKLFVDVFDFVPLKVRVIDTIL